MTFPWPVMPERPTTDEEMKALLLRAGYEFETYESQSMPAALILRWRYKRGGEGDHYTKCLLGTESLTEGYNEAWADFRERRLKEIGRSGGDALLSAHRLLHKLLADMPDTSEMTDEELADDWTSTLLALSMWCERYPQQGKP